MGTDTLGVISRIVEDAKHIVNKKICNRKSHAGESPHEEVGRVGKIVIERGETILDSVNPGVAMIKPTRIWMSEDPGTQKCNVNPDYVHVDQNDAQGPYICGTGLIHGSHVVPALCEEDKG